LRNDFLDLISGIKPDRNYIFDTMDVFFQNELTPTKSINLPVDLKVFNLTEEQKINLHFFILYENELGNFYDTYFWIIYENAPIGMKPIYSFHKETNSIYLKFDLMDNLKERFKVSIVKESYRTYSKTESERIVEYYKSLSGE